MNDIQVCPCTLKEGFDTYSPSARRHMFNGKKVSHILPYESLSSSKELMENQGRLSLSGAQEKFSAIADDGVIRLTNEGERGTYIIKPKLASFENKEYSPANEHLTMQIASQVYGIKTAENALCFTGNGEAVYLTRRYDIDVNGQKIHQEDFASLAGISKATHGANFKYDALDYVEIGNILKRYLPAWRIEIIKYFDLVLFNFVFANGDAHVKNFSVLETTAGDYRLAPAYDLINTLLHIPDGMIFALSKGLYPGWKREIGVYGSDFLKFGLMIGLDENTAKREIDRFCAEYHKTDLLIEHSFLSDALKQRYSSIYKTRINSYLKVF